MFTVENMACLIYLLALSAIDVRKRMIPLSLLAAGCAAAAAIRIADRRIPPVLALSGLAAGLVFLLVSRATREKIGYGDSMLITCLGIFLGALKLLELLFAAFSMSAVFSAAALAARRFHRDTKYPFVPFLAAAFFAMMCMGRMG